MLLNCKHLFLKHAFRNAASTTIFIENSHLYYVSLHFKLSSLFYSTQLVDIFAYELPAVSNTALLQEKKRKSIFNPETLESSVLIYNFHSVFFQQRLFLFVNQNPSSSITIKNKVKLGINSIAEVFPNSNWLEREVSELHGVLFLGKKDLRNLLLQYGDTSAPMQKSFPSIGTREIFYDSVTDLLVQSPTTIQF